MTWRKTKTNGGNLFAYHHYFRAQRKETYLECKNRNDPKWWIDWSISCLCSTTENHWYPPVWHSTHVSFDSSHSAKNKLIIRFYKWDKGAINYRFLHDAIHSLCQTFVLSSRNNQFPAKGATILFFQPPINIILMKAILTQKSTEFAPSSYGNYKSGTWLLYESPRQTLSWWSTAH